VKKVSASSATGVGTPSRTCGSGPRGVAAGAPHDTATPADTPLAALMHRNIRRLTGRVAPSLVILCSPSRVYLTVIRPTMPCRSSVTLK